MFSKKLSFLCFLIACLFITPIAATTVTPEVSSKPLPTLMFYNDKLVNTNKLLPIMKNDVLMVPLSPLAKEAGISLKFDKRYGRIIATKDKLVVEMDFGKNNALVGGNKELLDAPFQSVNGNGYVPLYSFAKFFNLEVDLDYSLIATNSKKVVGSILINTTPILNVNNLTDTYANGTYSVAIREVAGDTSGYTLYFNPYSYISAPTGYTSTTNNQIINRCNTRIYYPIITTGSYYYLNTSTTPNQISLAVSLDRLADDFKQNFVPYANVEIKNGIVRNITYIPNP